MMSIKRLKNDSDGIIDENSRSSAPFEPSSELFFRRDLEEESGASDVNESRDEGQKKEDPDKEENDQEDDEDDEDDSPYEEDDDDEGSDNAEVTMGDEPEEEDMEGELHEWEICTRSRQPFTEPLELGEDFFEFEIRKAEEEEEEEGDGDEAGFSSVTSSIASDEDDDDEEFQGEDDEEDVDDAPKLWELLNSDEEEEDDEDEEYQWNEENDEDEDGEEEDDDDEHLVVSDSELEDLRRSNGPSTLLQPQDIRRIRDALRCHIQLLAQLMMLAASSSQPGVAQVCARMLEDIIHLGRKANLPDSIMKGTKPERIEALLESYRQELQNPSGIDNPTWRQPISRRFDTILATFAPDLGFTRDLYPNLKRQKVNVDRKRKNWRNWSDSEINLVVLGFNKYGGKARGVASKIHEDFLPTREPHTITRIICEAQGKKRCDERFQPILNWFKTTESSRLTMDEERRLLHGVALQQVKTVDKVDFGAISSSLLPHISPAVLRKKMEDIVLREYQEKQAELKAKAAAAVQQNRSNNNNNSGMHSLLKAVASSTPLPSSSAYATPASST